MKTYFHLVLTLFLVLGAFNANGQTRTKTPTSNTTKTASVNDIEFLGKPINIKMDVFSKNITAKGFKLDTDTENKKIYVGTFSGYPNCKIIVSCQPQSKIIRRIEIQFPELNGKHVQAKEAFQNFSNQYKNKYKDIATIEEQNKPDIIGSFNNKYYTDKVKVTLCFIDSYQNSFVETEDSFSIVILNQEVIDIKEEDNSFSNDI